MPDFTTITYLKNGNPRQQEAYTVLIKHRVMELLLDYNPILVGTIPIAVDIAGSDLDIICHCASEAEFAVFVSKVFGHSQNFKIGTKEIGGMPSVVAGFMLDGFEVEVFGQNIPTTQQNGYRHMLAEYNLLQKYGTALRQEVISLKLKGLKTEPAFAQALGLAGDTYTTLLRFEHSA